VKVNQMSFHDYIEHYDWSRIEREIEDCSPDAVGAALGAAGLTPEGLMSLLSPAAEPFLEEMAQRSHRLTEQRFGRVISLFAPIYVSNVCTSSCVYCGFNIHNPVQRLTLTVDETEAEGRYLHQLGFRHLLLVSGEAPQIVTTQYLSQVVERLRPLFSSIAVEIYPMETAEYMQLVAAGVDGLVVYQETYNEMCYKEVHLGGRKQDYHWRMETPERGGAAGFRRIGIGALLGLSNWRVEGFFLALHALYLMRTCWKSHVTISFPRLRPAAGSYQPPFPLSDLHLVQLLTALRLFLPDAGLVLSTRETPNLRDHLIPLGITSMSAGSSTEPGGYAHESRAEPQFLVADERTPAVVAEVIRQSGYEPVWKDWDAAFIH
jgi:2-iminoacetate synthase